MGDNSRQRRRQKGDMSRGVNSGSCTPHHPWKYTYEKEKWKTKNKDTCGTEISHLHRDRIREILGQLGLLMSLILIILLLMEPFRILTIPILVLRVRHPETNNWQRRTGMRTSLDGVKMCSSWALVHSSTNLRLPVWNGSRAPYWCYSSLRLSSCGPPLTRSWFYSNPGVQHMEAWYPWWEVFQQLCP